MAEKKTYFLHLDSEGFPVMDGGIRADEEEFLKIVFKNLRRYQGDDKYPLFTEMNGNGVIVTSFDDPLVAQSISIENEIITWNFLGGLSYNCRPQDILVDEWNRLHAYLGNEKIPALMSRKAQASFLLTYPDLKKLNPAPYRNTAHSFLWNLAYKNNNIPWDMGKANPVFEAHAKRMIEISGSDWLIPGAGNAYEASMLEKAAKNVTALDLSPSAKESFQKLFPESQVKYLVSDFFTENLPHYDAILENYFFVALDPTWRKKTIQRVHTLLNPGGYYGGIFFTRFAAGGPPYGLSEWELKTHIESLFEIIEWQRSPFSHPKRQHMELWVLLKKK